LWSRIDAALPAALGEPPIQPLALFDMEDLETALGHIPLGYIQIAGASRAEDRRSVPPRRVRRLPGRRAAHAEHDAGRRCWRSAFAQLGTLLAETLQLDPEASGE
jgi:hypothetical protein